MARFRRFATHAAALGPLLASVGLVAPGLAGLGCASNQPEVGVAFDPLTPFPATATYAWDERQSKLPDDPRIDALNLDPVIKNAFGVVMGERGWSLATSDAYHYLASYELGINTWHGVEGSLSVGTLSITLVEAVSRRRVWMGFARAEVQIGLSPEHRNERFRAIFRKLLKDFPPSQQH